MDYCGEKRTSMLQQQDVAGLSLAVKPSTTLFPYNKW
jgi:hypothetical protein